VKKTEIVVAVALVVASVFTAGVVEAKRGPSSVTVCVNATGVVRRVAANAKCVGESQKWSASKLAPQLCWNASSVDPKGSTRLVSLAPTSGCVAPLRSVPVGKVVLLCADQQSRVLRWSVTRACKTGNVNTWMRIGTTKTASQISVPTTTIAQVVALVPSVSLSTTLITGGTLPKAVVVTSNVAGTVYFAEGAFPISKLSDITSADANRWASGVVYAGVPTSVPIDVTAVLNGYYRVYVANSQGVLSAPATNIVTISVTRAGQATTTTAPLSCAAGGACAVGDTGPGGGVVYILSTTSGNTTGLTFEAARNDWNGSAPDGTLKWCAATTVISGLSSAIGSGSSNSATMATTCTSTGADDAAEYVRGKTIGGKTDWFLPSRDEAIAIYTQRSVFTGAYATNGTDTDAARYLTSTQGANPFNALGVYMAGGVFPGNSDDFSKTFGFAVRPIRTFTAGS